MRLPSIFNLIYSVACLFESDYRKDEYAPDDLVSTLWFSLSYAQVSLLSTAVL